jgi:allophanate hydrolase subunit 1
VVGLHAALEAARRAGGAPPVEDLVPAERTVVVRFDPRDCSTDEVRAWLLTVPIPVPIPVPVSTAAAPDDEAARAADVVELPVRYDGADLEDVGRVTGLGPEGVVAAHSGSLWTVAFTGFSPGFGYLVGGDPRLVVPRLATPRVRVPAGSVALAGRYSGVYPRDSPGGWRLLGTTPVRVWDLDRDPPALLRPGVKVRFIPRELE